MPHAETTGRTWLTRLVLLPLIVALAFLSVAAFRKPLRAPEQDEFYYLTIARDLALAGTFTDGTFKRGPFNTRPGPEHQGDDALRWMRPGRFIAPLYPMLVYSLGRLDAGLADAVRCHVLNMRKPEQKACPTAAFRSLVVVNIAMWAIAMWAIFAVARTVSGSETVAWLAMIIALASGEPGYYVRTYLSENTTVPAFLLFMLFAARATRGGGIGTWLAAGVALGAAALSRPAYAYLFYFLGPALLALALLARRRFPALPDARSALAFSAATLLVMAPWMIRNQIQFGDPTLSRGYAELILMQRLSYNRMSLAEWGVAWIYWLPDFGDDLAKRLFRRELYELLGWSHPYNYYLDAGPQYGSFGRRIMSEAGSEEAVLGLLTRKYLVGDLPWHVLVSLPLTMRGLGVAKYLSVAAVLLAWPVMRRLAAERRLPPFLAMALPPILMAGLQGFVSVNIDRYNLPMLAVYATIVAVAAVEAWRRLSTTRRRSAKT